MRVLFRRFFVGFRAANNTKKGEEGVFEYICVLWKISFTPGLGADELFIHFKVVHIE